MSFNKIAFLLIILFYYATQTFGLTSIIESNETVKTIASYKLAERAKF